MTDMTGMSFAAVQPLESRMRSAGASTRDRPQKHFDFPGSIFHASPSVPPASRVRQRNELKRVLSPKRYRKLMIICNAKNRSLLGILNRSALFRERSAILHISSHHPVVSKNVQGP